MIELNKDNAMEMENVIEIGHDSFPMVKEFSIDSISLIFNTIIYKPYYAWPESLRPWD